MGVCFFIQSGALNGSVSIHKLFDEPESSIECVSSRSLEDITSLNCRGGWPPVTALECRDALIQAVDYLDAVGRSDISRVSGVSRNEERARRIMRTSARNQGTQISDAAVLADIKTYEQTAINMNTLISTLNALRRIFVIEDMGAFISPLYSQTAIRTSATGYFLDPSIADAALEIGPGALINGHKTWSFLFEMHCVCNLRVFAGYPGGTRSCFRNKAGPECDAVLNLRNSSYGLIEIKLGRDKLISEDINNLNKFSALIDAEKMKAPSFRMALPATSSYAPSGMMEFVSFQSDVFGTVSHVHQQITIKRPFPETGGETISRCNCRNRPGTKESARENRSENQSEMKQIGSYSTHKPGFKMCQDTR